MPLKPGDKAPDFTLLDQNGEPVSLGKSLKGRKALIYFYPKADTPGCTTQACGLRDILPQVSGDNGAAVVGISPDKPTKQASSTRSTALASPCWPTRTTPWPRRSTSGRRRACTAASTWVSSGRPSSSMR